MKAFVRDRYGSPDVMQLRDVAKPTVGDDGVLVRVHAASLNQADLDYLYGRPLLTKMGSGLRRPRVPGLGLDAAGEVEAVGSRVTAFKPGDRVFADLSEFGQGAFAEYAAAPERAWALMPPGMTFEEAATVPQSAILALQGFRSGRGIRPGDSVLINGASGNVGPWAVQIAKSFGAHVTGVASTAKLDLVAERGADHVIDYTREDYTRGGQRYDWILDIAGNRSLFENRRALKRGGTYVMIGGSTKRILAALLIGPLISVAGGRRLGLNMWWKPFQKDDVALLKQLIAAREITPLIDRTYPLDQVPDALRYLESGQARGKVVITVTVPATSGATNDGGAAHA
jgi:NADPH:quinone reductase-like Zn-dependent oxidoreductase